MNFSINGQSQVPPGFRFHPTEEELLHYYLRKKVASHKIDLDVIPEVDLNKLEPWDIQEKCKIGSTPQSDWYFFSHKDKKYPTGTRTNRATTVGFWKATGRDKIILSGIRRIGLRKTLVFYKGRAPHGQKSDWIMHEYRLDEDTHDLNTVSNKTGEYSNCGEDGWVICRVFKKKNYQKTEENSKASSNNSMDLIPHHHNQLPGSKNDGVLDQILLYMGRKCKLENEYSLMISDRFLTAKNDTNFITEGVDHSDSLLQDNYFMNLPRLLDSPTTTTLPSLNITNNINGSDLSFDQDPKTFKACYDQSSIDEMHFNIEPSSPNYKQDPDKDYAPKPSRLNDWVSLDRLVASQLNGDQEDSTSIDTIYKQLSFLGTDPNMYFSCSSSDQDKDGTLSYQYIRSGRSNNQTSTQVYMSSDDNDFWSFTKTSPSPSSSDPRCHLSV